MLIKESHVDVPTSANGKEGTMRMSSSTLTICNMRSLPTYTRDQASLSFIPLFLDILMRKSPESSRSTSF